MGTTFPLQRFSLLTQRPVLTRAGKSLEDQFAYRYAVANDGPGAAFLMQFGESLAIVALVYEDAAAHEARMLARAEAKAIGVESQ
jgi:hypothetical protein